jgi:colicin import membrane protein
MVSPFGQELSVGGGPGLQGAPGGEWLAPATRALATRALATRAIAIRAPQALPPPPAAPNKACARVPPAPATQQGVLKQRQQALRAREEEEAAASASAFRRGRGQSEEGVAPDATPELAAKLKRRQEEAARVAAEAAAAAAEAEKAAKGEADEIAWGNKAAPFGSELAAALQRRCRLERQRARLIGPESACYLRPCLQL